MKLICIEEHAVDQAIAQAARPVLQRDAPYMGLQSSPAAAAQKRASDRPSLVELSEAIRLADDLGDGRIQDMDQHGIDMQIVSYSSPTQLVPDEQAVIIARAANDRLAEAVRANPTRLNGFAALPGRIPAPQSTNWTERSANSASKAP